VTNTTIQDPRRALQLELQSLDHREAENVPSLLTFLPLRSHRMALQAEKVVILGGRGAGKSALFSVLRDLKEPERIRAFFEDPDLPECEWVDAFCQQAVEHPSVESLDDFARRGDDVRLRSFWLAHLLLRVTPREDWPLLPEGVPHDQAALHLALHGEVAPLMASLDRVEKRFEEKGCRIFAAYDHLDRLGSLEHQIRSRYIRSLLALWLSLSNRYRWLRAKIFLRDDLFDPARLAFPDATKLQARSIALEWNVEALYRVAVRHQSRGSEEMRAWLRGVPGLELKDRGEFGWMPGDMPDAVIKAYADRLAGEQMGSGVKKGYTWRWIPNRLQDAKGKVVPRSILTLLGEAAKQAVQRGSLPSGLRLLMPQDLAAALGPTSQQRVAEVQEEYGLTARLRNLEGQQVMMRPELAEELLGRPRPEEAPEAPTDGQAVLEELINLGVLSRRKDGRIDVPDIYRYGFGIKRKGGVARPR